MLIQQLVKHALSTKIASFLLSQFLLSATPVTALGAISDCELWSFTLLFIRLGPREACKRGTANQVIFISLIVAIFGIFLL